MRRQPFQRLCCSPFSSLARIRDKRWRLWRDDNQSGSRKQPPNSSPPNTCTKPEKNRQGEGSRILAELKESKNLKRVKELHAQAVDTAQISNQYVGNSLINRYAKCGSMVDARNVFNKLSHRDVVSWNSLLQGYVDNGDSKLALNLFEDMQKSPCAPDARTYVAALKACTSLASRKIGNFGQGKALSSNSKFLLQKGALIHSQALKNRCCNGYVENTLINLYAACGSMVHAREVFDGMKFREPVAWNTLLQGYVDNGESEVAVQMFERMDCAPDARTYVSALAACAALGNSSGGDRKWLEKGRSIHSEAARDELCDRFVESILVDMYSKCRSMSDARRVFDGIVFRDTVCWTVLLQGYVDNGEPEMALELFEALKRSSGCRPDARTYGVALTACATLAITDRKWLDEGSAIHSQAVKERCCDMFVESKVVDMFAKFGEMEKARSVFDGMIRRDVVSWTALLQGYADSGRSEVVLELFDQMEAAGGDCRADGRAYVLALSACAALAGKLTASRERMLERGKSLYARAATRRCCDGFVVNSMINLYAKCGRMPDARKVFDKAASERTEVTWNCLIQGYVDNGEDQTALDLVSEMKARGVAPNAGTFVAAITACGNLMAMESAEDLHLEIRSRGLEKDVLVGTCLLSFYCKCGCMDEARQLFDLIEVKDLWTWNTMLGGFTRKGETDKVFELFQRMKEQQIPPNEITFVHLLTACGQAGLTDDGKKLFESMSSKHGVAPDIMHYSCMVDLLGRANRVDEAVKMVKSMPFEPDVVIWRSLLGACKKWNNVSVAEVAYESLLKLDETDPAAYVLMANIYKSSGMADKEAQLLQRLNE